MDIPQVGDSGSALQEHEAESDGSRYITGPLVPERQDSTKDRPILICFHGSGTNASHDWEDLVQLLIQHYQVVLFDRGPQNPNPDRHLEVLWEFLIREKLIGPYTLVAHSYGGLFAKHFLNLHPDSVAGMVLAETGKGGDMDLVQARLLKGRRLGSRPLSVIRANSFLREWQALPAVKNKGESAAETIRQHEKMEWLKRCDEEDERLEREQLKLSKNARFVHLPDCGHNVVRDRPQIVMQEVKWIVEQYIARPAQVSWLMRIRGKLSISPTQ